MAKKAANIFRVAGAAVDSYSGASDFTTDAMDLRKYKGEWHLICFSDHSSGTPSVTIEISDNSTNWVEYQTESTNVAVSNWFSDNMIKPKYIRVVYVANSSNGNVTLKFIKDD